MLPSTERIFILTKTYPSPSSKYIETSCVAGINELGRYRRLFPVPFRLISGEKQFHKWQWITVQLSKASNDNRPESFHIYTDSISRDPKPLSTSRKWQERWRWLDLLHIASEFNELEQARQTLGYSLALLRPKSVLSLDIKKAKLPDWTDEELNKLLKDQRQMGLFNEGEARKQLRKLPHDFYYNYVCESPSGKLEYTHKIVDWEVGALYWNCKHNYGESWEKPFRTKMEQDLLNKDLIFLMGTIHRFPSQWLIVGLIYPPKRSQQLRQDTLF